MQFPAAVILAGLAASSLALPAFAASPVIKDIFDRDVTQRGLTLIDWEGYMGNPAIEFTVIPPSDAVFPLQAIAVAREPRLYFDLPSDAGAQGPKKQLTFRSAQPLSMLVSIFPARDKKKKETALNFQLTDATSRRWQLNVPIHVVVTEHPADLTGTTTPATTNPAVFPITVDFAQDQTGFFKDESRRKLFDQAIQDWAFYLAPIPLKPVAAGAEKTWIFEPAGFAKSHLTTNAERYTGYLLYGYGINSPEIRSGGEPSRAGLFQQSDNTKLPFRRSGGVELEIKGNYNRLGWNFNIRDEEWWKATNRANVPNDFYSVVHHESGHALFFNPANSKFLRNSVLQDDALRAYLGGDAHTDTHDHFDGILDPASLRGAFGNEYHGKFPDGRWLITKFDLLAAQAVGYTLRTELDSLVPLALQSDELPPAALRKIYTVPLHAHGGIPFYDWTLTEGKLPAGLTLNRFTGEITGTPTQMGTANFSIQVRDYTKNGAGISRPFTMEVHGQ